MGARGRPTATSDSTETLPDKGFFVILRMYGPTRAFFGQSWKPGDLERLP